MLAKSLWICYYYVVFAHCDISHGGQTAFLCRGRVTEALKTPGMNVSIKRLLLYPCRLKKRRNIMDLIAKLAEMYKREDELKFEIGDTVKVYVKVKEGTRERLQIFEGTVIGRKHGGTNETFTVRRVTFGIGVERVFPIHCPSVAKVEVVRRAKVRRAKLYYLRDRVGKAAKIKEKL